MADRGSDQVYQQKLVRVCLHSLPSTIDMHFYCQLHNGHIIDHNLMTMIDDKVRSSSSKPREWKYFNALAKFSTCWREKPRQWFLGWKTMHGLSSAIQYARAAMPKCLSGRWGSRRAVQKRLIQLGTSVRERMTAYIKAARFTYRTSDRARQQQKNATRDCAPSSSSTTTIAATSSPAVQSRSNIGRGRGRGRGGRHSINIATCTTSIVSVDGSRPSDQPVTVADETVEHDIDITLEQTQLYVARMGKYRSDCLATAHDELFWITSALCNRADAPLDHFTAVLRKLRPMDKVVADGPAFSELVVSKCDAIANDWCALHDDASYYDIIRSVGHRDPCVTSEYVSMAVALVLGFWTDFSVRVLDDLNRCRCPVCARYQPLCLHLHRVDVGWLLYHALSVHRFDTTQPNMMN